MLFPPLAEAPAVVTRSTVTPAKAGVHCSGSSTTKTLANQLMEQWIPAFAGMTEWVGSLETPKLQCGRDVDIASTLTDLLASDPFWT